jgi:hypothetical protein
MPHPEPTTILPFLSSLCDALSALFARFTSLDRLLPTSLLDLEHHLAALLRSFQDQLVHLVLTFWLSHTSLLSDTSRAYKAAFPNASHKQNREVSLTFLGGHTYIFRIPFMKHRHTGPGRKRASGKRGPSKGLAGYPVLQALGFVGKYSPAAALARGMAAVGATSFLAARQQLAPVGLDSGQRSLLGSTDELGELCFSQLDEWLEEPSRRVAPWGDSFDITGKTLVVTLDGGRARLRISKRGRRRKNGHHGFDTAWVEPRLFTLYVTDKDGRQDKHFGKLVDGGLEDADALVQKLTRYLRALGVERAARVVVVADGAPWIWARLAPALLDLGVESGKVSEVLDFYHASEHIHQAAKAQEDWSQGFVRRWGMDQTKLLKQGRVAEIISTCDKLFREERREEMEGLANYLESRQHMCRYKEFEQTKIPCGSGVIESAVRQVLCMRVKGVGKFWREEQCEQMTRLRSWHVAGRLESLMVWALERRAAWWAGSIKPLPCNEKSAA